VNEQLEPRELDALVAEKVLGIPPEMIHNQEGGKHFKFVDGRECRIAVNAYYSTNIGAAWQVVEKCKRLKLSQMSDGYWRAAFSRDGVWESREAETASRAICLAALAAVEGLP